MVEAETNVAHKQAHNPKHRFFIFASIILAGLIVQRSNPKSLGITRWNLFAAQRFQYEQLNSQKQ